MAETATQRSEKTAQALADLVNPYQRDDKTFVEYICYRTHRTLQQSIAKLIFKLLRTWAEMHKQDRFDLRNEATCKTAREICELMDAQSEFKGQWDNLPLI